MPNEKVIFKMPHLDRGINGLLNRTKIYRHLFSDFFTKLNIQTDNSPKVTREYFENIRNSINYKRGKNITTEYDGIINTDYYNELAKEVAIPNLKDAYSDVSILIDEISSNSLFEHVLKNRKQIKGCKSYTYFYNFGNYYYYQKYNTPFIINKNDPTDIKDITYKFSQYCSIVNYPVITLALLSLHKPVIVNNDIYFIGVKWTDTSMVFNLCKYNVESDSVTLVSSSNVIDLTRPFYGTNEIPKKINVSLNAFHYYDDNTYVFTVGLFYSSKKRYYSNGIDYDQNYWTEIWAYKVQISSTYNLTIMNSNRIYKRIGYVTAIGGSINSSGPILGFLHSQSHFYKNIYKVIRLNTVSIDVNGNIFECSDTIARYLSIDLKIDDITVDEDNQDTCLPEFINTSQCKQLDVNDPYFFMDKFMFKSPETTLTKTDNKLYFNYGITNAAIDSYILDNYDSFYDNKVTLDTIEGRNPSDISDIANSHFDEQFILFCKKDVVNDKLYIELHTDYCYHYYWVENYKKYSDYANNIYVYLGNGRGGTEPIFKTILENANLPQSFQSNQVIEDAFIYYINDRFYIYYIYSYTLDENGTRRYRHLLLELQNKYKD